MRLRTVASRSRKGCITCKIRRVKCDEEKPSCHRCRSTGRKCDGYGPPSALSASTTNNQTKDMHIIQHTPQLTQAIRMWMLPSFDRLLTETEYRSLEFFHLQTVSCFGTKAGDFLLRAAYHDPSIRLAAMALGSLHRTFLLEGYDQSRQQKTQFALRQYNSAIRQTLNLFSRMPEGSTDVLLSMCILFFCFESLQGHFKMAVQHVISGLRILKQQESRCQTEGKDALLPSNIIRIMFNTIESQILEIDWGLTIPVEVQLALLSPSQLPSVRMAEETPCTLEGISESFGFLYNQFLKLLALLSISEHSEDGTVSETLAQVESHYLNVKRDIYAWSATLDRYLKTHPVDERERDDHQASNMKILEMWRIMMGIVLKVEGPLFSPSTFDKYTSDFSIVVSLAEKIISLTTPTHSRPNSDIHDCLDEEGKSRPLMLKEETCSPTRPASTSYIPILPKSDPSLPLSCSFSVSLGILTPLWIVATSCRDSQTRYRAINLMRRSRRREGIWDSNLYSRLAMRVVSMEEQAAGIQEGAEYRAADIPVSARVKAMTGRFCDGREGKVEFFRDGFKLSEETVSW
ncbi:hypothetical protein V1517DRAFT_189944 [Lipomyces orientalis]|uniref:Uncharacterized protein n=1 Tax=Lipomyces orientalis TaxID=1233043 RepID=A0ACC3TW66_9ASCO